MSNYMEKMKILFASTIIASFIFSGTVFGTEEFKLNISEEYKKWDSLSEEEKNDTLMPRTFEIEVPESILNNNVNKMPILNNQLLRSATSIFNNVSATTSDSKYNLANRLNLRVEDQKSTTECWAFSLLKSTETNNALQNKTSTIPNYSERHMDYATSRTFLDGINENGFQREVGKGGLLLVGLAYLTNGQGAVVENDMPFENNEKKINLSEINKPVDTIVNDYAILPTIHKSYSRDSKGNTKSVRYAKNDGTEYTSEELEAIRNIIKQHLIKYGAIATMTGGSLSQYYNNSIFSATNYNCNNSTKIRDHAITIVGWDDNYSRNNFADGAKPSTDGAYIVLNSYSDKAFDKGYMYVSYEDYFIEQELYGIQSTSKINYDNLYQYDYYGGVYALGVNSSNEGYYGVTYDRKSSQNEIIDSVGVTIPVYANLEIYVNPYDDTLDKNKLVKVATTNKILDPGYHRIDIKPTQLKGESFAVVVKQKSENESFYFQIEANIENTAFGLVDSESRSFISTNGTNWTNIADLKANDIDLSKADVCIKAFTKTGQLSENDEELSSRKYEKRDSYLMNIPFQTKISELLENLSSTYSLEVLTDKNVTINDNDEIIKTGMKLKLSNGKIFTLIVRGDISKDGKVSILDISKLILHYNQVRDCELIGDEIKAADMNLDGKVSIIDISQLVLLYNSI